MTGSVDDINAAHLIGEALDALLAYRERAEWEAEQAAGAADEPTAVAAEHSPAAIEQARRLSAKAKALIVDYETGGRANYEQRYKSRAVWPKGKSGITLGCGYDLGYVRMFDFEEDWAAVLHELTSGQRQALKACVGFHSGKDREDTMRTLLASVQDIVISWKTALEVFEATTLPKFALLTANALPRDEALNGDCFGALVSLTFNRGASYSKAHDPAQDPRDRYREMRGIKAALANGEPAKVPSLIRAMIRIWVGTDIENGMKRRRADEARLFAEGLANEVLGVASAATAEVSLDAIANAADASVAAMFVSDIPADAESWQAAGDEEAWEEVTEDQLAAEAEDGALAGASAAGATWAADDVQPDYSHLGPALPRGGTFTLRAEDLALLARMNAFNIDSLDHETPVLFGLRGAGIIKDHDEGGIVLVDQRPDHVTPRCVMGVWDRRTGRVSVFPGSTVPNQAAVAKFRRDGTAGNLLATGFYGYVCGPHTTKNQSTPGAFLLRTPDMKHRVVVVRRSKDDLTYQRTDMVHRCGPGDNIHPTFFLRPVGFSSLGCQTVAGNFKGGSHQGPWAQFRQAAGLGDNDGVLGKPFSYMLLTGAEARIAAQLRVDGLASDPVAVGRLRRLRAGSQGAAVRRLQEQLGLEKPDGVMGPFTTESLHKAQARLGGGSDGIYSQAMDQRLGWNVLEAANA